jgi:hypothetical protein
VTSRNFGIILAAALGALGATSARSAVLEAQASLNPVQAMTGETIQLVVRVSADKKEELPWPRVEGLSPFTVTRNTSISSGSQTSIVNGTITRTEHYVTEFIYGLTAQRPGEYTVGPIRYVHKDFQRDLGSATVSVTKGDAGILTRPMLGKSRVYVGEQTLYTLRIVPKEGVQSVNWPRDMQKYIGQKFFFQPIDSMITPKTATVDGRETQVLDLRIVLFPLLAGPTVLEGMPVEYRQVRRAPRSSPADMFEEFFGGGGRVITQTLQSPSLRLEALPLPGKAPEDFSGAVGKYTLSAKLDRGEAATGDAVSLTVVIRGNGQPKSVLQPTLPDLSRFEVYDPEKTSASTVENGVLWTTHTFKYALIPNREGDYDFRGISFAYFDPARAAYARAEAPALKLRVVPGKGGSGGGSYASQREITELGTDIRFLKTQGPALRDDSDLPYRHAGFALLLALPPLAFAGAFLARRRRERLRADSALMRRSQAGKKLRARLKEARAALDAGNLREFYRALSEAMAAFASDRLNREFRGLTQAEARAALAERGASPATVEAWDALLQRCDFMLFAGAGASPEETRRDLEAGEKLLAALDKELA